MIPVGGGGFISGMATATKLVNPDCNVVGVEPFGADSMWRSFQKGEAVELEQVKTIADSLGAPMARPNTFSIVQRHVSEIVRLRDEEMCKAMAILYDALKVVAEPACAATTAAISPSGPLAERLQGRQIGIVACGSNISIDKFKRLTM